MRVKFLPIFVLFLFIFSSSVVLAEESTESGTLIQQKQAANREALQEKKQQLMDNIQSKKEAYREKLATIKNQQKQQTVEGVTAKITTLNTNQIARMNAVLEKINSILSNLKQKAAAIKNEGKDTSAVDGAIVAAETAVAEAQTAVSTQAAKEYTITINTERTLKRDVGSTISQFRADMQATHKSVVNAKQSVMNVVRELAILRGTPIATGSAISNN